MEAFSAVVNICSFIDLSIKLIAKLNKYIFDVKSADDSSKRFVKELRRIVQVLQAFQSLVEELEQQSSPESKERLGALRSFFDDISPQTQNLYKELTSLYEPLAKRVGDREEMGLVQRMKWASSGKKKVETILPELSRHVEIFNLALSIDSR